MLSKLIDIRIDTSKKYALVDRLGFEFRFIPDNIQTVTTVFNSRITSIETKDFMLNHVESIF